MTTNVEPLMVRLTQVVHLIISPTRAERTKKLKRSRHCDNPNTRLHLALCHNIDIMLISQGVLCGGTRGGTMEREINKHVGAAVMQAGLCR